MLAELGFQAAEMRVLNAQLADACAKKDSETACDVGQVLLEYHRDFLDIFRKVLAAHGGRHQTLRVVPDYSGIQERTSV